MSSNAWSMAQRVLREKRYAPRSLRYAKEGNDHVKKLFQNHTSEY